VTVQSTQRTPPTPQVVAEVPLLQLPPSSQHPVHCGQGTPASPPAVEVDDADDEDVAELLDDRELVLDVVRELDVDDVARLDDVWTLVDEPPLLAPPVELDPVAPALLVSAPVDVPV
jgi:hypothetical protein